MAFLKRNLLMENQSEKEQMITPNPCKKRVYRYALTAFTLMAAVFIGVSYNKIRSNYINIDSTITSAKSSIENYKKCHLENSCKAEDEKKLEDSLWSMEAIYSRNFFSLGKFLENEDISKFNSFTKGVVNSLVDMKKYKDAISLIAFSNDYIKPDETKQVVKTIYENRSSLDIVYLFTLTGLLKENGYFLESTTLSMSIPDHIPLAASRKLMETFLLFGCRDDLLVWGSYYAKLTPETFLRDELQGISKKEYFEMIRNVDGDTLDKINKTSSDMVLLKKYPELSQSCQISRFSIYN